MLYQSELLVYGSTTYGLRSAASDVASDCRLPSQVYAQPRRYAGVLGALTLQHNRALVLPNSKAGVPRGQEPQAAAIATHSAPLQHTMI